MRILIGYLLLIVCSPSFGQEVSAGEIKGSKFIQYVTIGDTSGRKGLFDSTVTEIYSNGKISLYKLSYGYSSSYNSIELASEERFHYFIHSNDSLYGYDYDGYQEPFVKRVSVDSILRSLRETKINVDTLFDPTESKLLSSYHNADSGTAREAYTICSKDNTSQPATFFLEYSRQYISPELNPLKVVQKFKDMNLCKLRILSDCYPCSFDMNYSIENIKTIKENITQIFDDYIERQSGIQQQTSSGYTIRH